MVDPKLNYTSSEDVVIEAGDSSQSLERNNLILVLVGTLVSCLFKKLGVTLSFVAGGMLTIINLRLLRLIVAALVGRRTLSKGKLVAQVLIKFVGMMGLLAVLMLVFRPVPIPFLLGLSTLVVAILIEGISGIFRSDNP